MNETRVCRVHNYVYYNNENYSTRFKTLSQRQQLYYFNTKNSKINETSYETI